jgi:hypothetical protein
MLIKRPTLKKVHYIYIGNLDDVEKCTHIYGHPSWYPCCDGTCPGRVPCKGKTGKICPFTLVNPKSQRYSGPAMGTAFAIVNEE